MIFLWERLLNIEESISRLKINLIKRRTFYGLILMINKDVKIANIAADFLVNYYIDIEKMNLKRQELLHQCHNIHT